MGYLHEGNRVTTAVAGTQADSSRYNSFQDQLAEMLGPRWMTILSGFSDGTWDFKADTSYPGYWIGASGAAQEKLFMPITLPSGCTIKEIVVRVFSGAAVNNGDIGLYRIAQADVGTATWSPIQDIGGANPWSTGHTTHSASGLSIVLADGYSYAIIVTPSDDASATLQYIYFVKIQFEYGNH